MYASNPFRYGSCEVCASPYKILLREVGASRTKREIPFYFCMHCRSFTCVQDYHEDDGQLRDDVAYNVSLMDDKLRRFGGFSTFLANYVKRLTGKEPGSLSYADVGCNLGILVKTTQQAGFTKAVGYDLNTLAIFKGRELFPQLDLRAVCFCEEGQSYDVVTLVDVLEHIATPREFIQCIVNHVNPGGIVYITVPRLDENLWSHLSESIASELSPRDHTFPLRDNDVHIIHFSTAGLIELCSAYGLKLIEDFNSSEWPLNGIFFQKA